MGLVFATKEMTYLPGDETAYQLKVTIPFNFIFQSTNRTEKTETAGLFG